MDKGKVGVTDAELELAHCLDERCGLDVSDCPPELDFGPVCKSIQRSVKEND